MSTSNYKKTINVLEKSKNIVYNITKQIIRGIFGAFSHRSLEKGIYSMQDKLTTPTENTITFSVRDEKELEMRAVLSEVYEALREKGYNPLHQIVGYILSEDPTYITNYKNARSLIRRIDRDELLRCLVRAYLDIR